MGAKLEGSIKRYIGTSTDDKPAPGMQLDGTTLEANQLLPGSSFLETDTGQIWRWNGTTWTLPMQSGDASAEWLGLIYAKLAELTDILSDAAD